MKKSGILHAELAEAIARARHGDMLMVLDAGMPVPRGCRLIDLGLVRGMPSFLTVVKAILGDLIVERYETFDLMAEYNPDMQSTLRSLMPAQGCAAVTREEMQRRMPDAVAVIRTGEFGSCCNMTLYSASGRDAYVEKYNVCCEGTEETDG